LTGGFVTKDVNATIVESNIALFAPKLLMRLTLLRTSSCSLCLKANIVTASKRRQIPSIGNIAQMVLDTLVDMRVEDFYPQGKRWWVRLHEKGGKRHEMPAHHTLEAYLDAYIDAAGIRDSGKSPLFRSAAGRI
jgi:hypothetical protein